MNTLLQRFGLTRPVVLAPMAGGVSTPELAAAVSEQGGLGSLGMAYLTPAQMKKEFEATRNLTKKPFALNLFVTDTLPALKPKVLAQAIAELAPFHTMLGLPRPRTSSTVTTRLCPTI